MTVDGGPVPKELSKDGAIQNWDATADRKTLYAVMRALEIIGEAAKRIPDDIRFRQPDIDWRGMAGLGDVIIHQYDRIDPGVPFHVATAQLPAMIDRLGEVVAEERRLAGEPGEIHD